MKRYVAVDSGKFATKVAFADNALEGITEFKFRTKTGPGSFDDDAVEPGTYVAEIDGAVYKIGNGAPREAELDTSKKTLPHKLCTMLALAIVANPEGDEFAAAAGMPVGPYSNVEARKEYKEYILPLGQHTVTYMTQPGTKVTKKFSIVSHYVYPESAGGLYLDMEANKETAAVVDIGNVNVNATLFQNFSPDYESSNTSELGGQMLITGLAAALSAEMGARVDEKLASRTLKLEGENRCLHPTKPDPAIEEKSRKFIDSYLLSHVKDIKRSCDALRWPLSFMQVTFIGGTSDLLKKELKEVFGDSCVIPDKPELANVRGFLRRLVAWEEKKLLPLG